VAESSIVMDRRAQDEGETVGEEDLRALSDCAAQGRCAGYLQEEPASQAEAGQMRKMLAFVVAATSLFAQQKEAHPFIVARVDHVVITRTDVERYLQIMGGQYFRLRWSWLQQERLFARYMFGKALRELILDEVLLQYARRKGWLDVGRPSPTEIEEPQANEPRAGPVEKQEPLRLTPDWETQVNKALEEMIRRAGGMGDFAAMLRRANLSLDYIRDRIRIRFLWERVQRQIEKQLPPVSAQDIRKFYSEHMKEFLQGKDVVVFREIGIRRGDVNSKIEEVKKALTAGEDFGKVARRLSDLSSAKNGGLCRNELDSLRHDMRKLLLALKPGEFTKEPFWDGSAYTFLQLVRVEHAKPKPLEAVCAQIRARLRAQHFTAAFKRFISKLLKAAKIEVYERGLSVEDLFPQSDR